MNLPVESRIIAAMPTVHPTAILGNDVQLADDVQIGPWCCLDGRITLGPGCRLLQHVHLRGPLTVGANNVFYPNACIGFPPQDRKFDPDTEGAGVAIGDDNILREGVTIHAATGERPTLLGNNNYLMCNTHLGHDARVGNRCTLANQSLLAGHVHLADQVTLGGNAVIHQYCRIGRLAMLSGSMGVVQDLPPFCVTYNTRFIGSLNLVGLRRSNLRDHIKPMQRAFDIFFKQRHTVPVALELIDAELNGDPLVHEFTEFIRGTTRGITPYRRSDVPD